MFAPARPWILASIVLGLAACGGTSPRPAHGEAPTAIAAPRIAANARAIYDRYRDDRALEAVAEIERHFRVRGNEGYHATIDRIRTDLLAAGAGALEETAVRTLELGEVSQAWTPRSASLTLLGAGDVRTPLVAFGTEADPDRACLLVNSDAIPATSFEVVTIEQVHAGTSAEGRLVLAAAAPTPTLEEVAPMGAAGVIVHWVESYHHAADHPDVAQFGYLSDLRGTHVGFSIGAADYAALTAATASGPARVEVAVDVARAPSAATAIEARIAGTEHDLPPVVFVAHVDEPGANDNASGVAALVQLARVIVHAMDEGAIAQPARSIVFVWGQEIEVSGAWLDAAGENAAAAGLVFDMVGSDPAATGAPFLIERMPDPGAVWLRAPDVHSEWGASEVPESDLHGHFLNDATRAAVASVAAIDGPWETRDHPFEGGSDHVSFLRRGLPGILAWHFTDEAYHTTRDRLDRVSAREMRRVSAAMGAVALAMAATDLRDRRELLEVVEASAHARLDVAVEGGLAMLNEGSDLTTERHVIEAWGRWYVEALDSVGQWGAPDPGLNDEIRAAQERVREHAREAMGRIVM